MLSKALPPFSALVAFCNVVSAAELPDVLAGKHLRAKVVLETCTYVDSYLEPTECIEHVDEIEVVFLRSKFTVSYISNSDRYATAKRESESSGNLFILNEKMDILNDSRYSDMNSDYRFLRKLKDWHFLALTHKARIVGDSVEAAELVLADVKEQRRSRITTIDNRLKISIRNNTCHVIYTKYFNQQKPTAGESKGNVIVVKGHMTSDKCVIVSTAD